MITITLNKSNGISIVQNQVSNSISVITPSDNSNIVSITSSQQLNGSNASINTSQTLTILKGLKGLSAYLLAVLNGYTGTLNQWLSSLRMKYSLMTLQLKQLLLGDITNMIRIATTSQWQTLPTYVPYKGQIIVFIDLINSLNSNIKIGDGNAYVVDLPFITQSISYSLLTHIADTSSHISMQDRQKWDNKITCLDNVYELILVITKN